MLCMFFNLCMATILGIKLDNRLETAAEFQKIITGFGCEIRTRLGLHETEQCSNYGIIILEVNDKSAEKVISALSKKWIVKQIVF